MGAPLLRLDSVSKPSLGLHGVSLAIPMGATTVLLGAAGSGRTGVLRLLAGLASPDTGRLLLDGAPFDRPPPGWRGAGLWQPLGTPGRLRTVEQVVTAPVLGLPPRERAAHVARALTAFGLDGQEAQRVDRLGELPQRRLALARAIAPLPSLLLLDEPFAGLDQALRERLALELRAVLREAGMTAVLATREREEALLLAAHLAVLEDGQVAQEGTPQQLYDEPASAAVAALTGECNRLPGTVLALEEAECQVRLDCGPELWTRRGDVAGPGSRCVVAVRPERVAVAAMRAEEMGEGALPAALRDIIFRGDHWRLELELGRGGSLIAKRPAGSRVPRPGGPAAVAWDPYAGFAFRVFR
ncbi:ABC transporter ATP-binding protein [Paracraurococcus lichenis]|uniref:ABC transporter ATP-binding protein n=1 Tax=Paracraurococcus lichenis TaxID=3064888 RepID=A0ABT9E1W0_9PROT|nr:ABC transporter ATP-binding protein [Paracraurococcus sp. LOR1-02]MDO9710152.1 ABC transporter ATP-binding protein [Paracraurococcus sp. LOR1-02]